MSTEYWYNDTLRGKLTYSGGYLSQCYSVPTKPTQADLQSNPGPQSVSLATD